MVFGIVTKVKIVDQKDRVKDLEALVEEEAYLTYFALHDGSAYNTSEPLNRRAELFQTWNGWFKSQPIHKIRAYYGERIAFHFSWLGIQRVQIS